MIAPATSLSSLQQALDARRTVPALTAWIGGVMTPVLSYTGQHVRGQTATGRLVLPLPRPAQVRANAEVLVQGGHNDLIGAYFAGYIPAWEFAMTRRGDLLTVDLVGWTRRMTEPFREDVVYRGPVDAGAVFADLCRRCGVPSSIAHAALFPNGESLTLGGNPNVDDGTITIRADSSPLGQFQRLVEPYKYFVSDTAAGPVLLHRTLGEPSGEPVVTFREGVHLGDTTRRYDTGGIVNAWDINGVTYTDQWGGQVPIRSIADPASVPPHDEIVGGYRYRRERNSDLVRADQAEAARTVAEITSAAAAAPVTWEGVAVPGLAPGDVVAVEAETVEASGRYWLVSIDVSVTERGMLATYEGEIGGGDTYPGIVDRVTRVIQVGPVHTGDEYVAHYAVPSPAGVEVTWPFSLPERVTVANCRGWCHSYNSQTEAGKDTELTVTRWEVWEAGVDRANDDNQPVSSGTMPVQAERYYSGISFVPFATAAGLRPGDDGYVTNPGEWVPFAVNLKTLDAGEYVLVLKNGKKAGYDDGEVRAVWLELYGLTAAAGSDLP